MPIYVVIAQYPEWDGGDRTYAYCATREIAERMLQEAHETGWDDDEDVDLVIYESWMHIK